MARNEQDLHRKHEYHSRKEERFEGDTLAGQAGKPLTFASTRSPKLKCPFALALFAPRRRAGGMTTGSSSVLQGGRNRKTTTTQWKRGRNDRKTLEKSRGGAAGILNGDSAAERELRGGESDGGREMKRLTERERECERDEIFVREWLWLVCVCVLVLVLPRRV